MKLSRISYAATGLLAAAVLASCASASGSDASEPDAPEAEFPVTIEVPGQEEPLVVEEEPERIVALSSDAAIAMHELGLTDRLVAVPEVALNPTLNGYAEEMADIPNQVGGENTPEPEQVLSWDPDLVVVTARHTGEQDASAQLTETGVPVLSLTNGWSSSDAITENLELIGEATGQVAEAGELTAEIDEGVTDVRERGEQAEERPTVAVLSNQARAPFINSGDSLVSELVANGGGVGAADAIGIDQTMPVQPEQLVAAEPDYIMLVDVTGKGEESFDTLLKNPAVAELPAVADGDVKLFPGKDVYGLAGREVVSGSEEVLEWLHPDLAG